MATTINIIAPKIAAKVGNSPPVTGIGGADAAGDACAIGGNDGAAVTTGVGVGVGVVTPPVGG